MSGDPRVLVAEIQRTQGVFSGIQQRMRSARERDIPKLGRTDLTAVFVAQLLDNYYTAAETLFLRVSQFFENSLAPDRWHADLLEKMSLHVPGVRQRVISDGTSHLLHELMRFRHFKRYYLELEYDWAKLDFLLEVYDRLLPLLQDDLREFTGFLEKLSL